MNVGTHVLVDLMLEIVQGRQASPWTGLATINVSD